MGTGLFRRSEVTVNYTVRGLPSSYSIEVWHSGLGIHRELRARDYQVLMHKLSALEQQLETRWAQEQVRMARTASAESAAAETALATKSLDECDRLLVAALRLPRLVDWEGLKDHRGFEYGEVRLDELSYDESNGQPIGIISPDGPRLADPGPAPTEDQFPPAIRFWHVFSRSTQARLRAEASEAFSNAVGDWESRKAAGESQYESDTQSYYTEVDRRTSLLNAELIKFDAARRVYEERQAIENQRVDALEAAWRSRKSAGVRIHAETVLAESEYPGWFAGESQVEFDESAGSLVVDFRLPSPSDLPSLERVTYVKARDERTEKRISQARADKLFDSVCRQIAVRTLHELFSADEVDALRDVTFNGWVQAVNPATGREERGCILSVRAFKEEFLEFNLANVDPRACIRQLRGVAASSLAGLAPVRPVLQLDTSDPRFVDSRAASTVLDESVNLAAMAWEDFEHLVREVFGMVFSTPGSEVRITQASRDGGVDAIAFDPDPIRGGKIVIQAKRYTNVVGVGAVRDLYGTLMNEGANRGILVTTSTYGPDAHKFALNKPITLLDGAQLLGLLEQHGKRARIDIAEARRLQAPE